MTFEELLLEEQQRRIEEASQWLDEEEAKQRKEERKMRWYDYLHRTILEIQGDQLRIASLEEGVQSYPLNGSKAFVIKLHNYLYRTRPKPGRKPNWLKTLEAWLEEGDR